MISVLRQTPALRDLRKNDQFVHFFLKLKLKREEQELTREESNLPDVSIIDLLRGPPPPRRLNPHSRPMKNRKYFTLSPLVGSPIE